MRIDAKGGVMTIPEQIGKKYIEPAKAIAVFISEDKALIGLQPLEVMDRDGYKIRTLPDGRAYRMNCMALVRVLDLKETTMYEAKWEEDMLVLRKKEEPPS